MPKTDLINFETGRFWGVNTHFKIGAHFDNPPADVMMIQTLFRYLSFAGGYIKGELGYGDGDLPEVNGKFDTRTQSVLRKFQQKNRAKLITTDGTIHPASYEGRTLKMPHWQPLMNHPVVPVMTITLLHIYAWYTEYVFNRTANYVGHLVAMTPELKSWLIK
jgi:hypothetical protein